MELTSTIINGIVVTLSVGVLGYYLRDRFRQVDARFDAVERRMERLEDRVESSIDSLRSDLTAVALAVGAKPRASRG
jgi:hypothetical protein